MLSTQTGYAQSQGMKLLESTAQELSPVFSLEQLKPLADRQGLSTSHLRKLVSVLAEAGWIEILKRGAYALRSPMLTESIAPFAIAAILVQPMAISHWSALAHHGFTTQLPAMIQASTPRKVVTPEMRRGQALRPRGRAVWRAMDFEIEFLRVQQKHFFGHQTIWADRWHQVSITDPERTALDLIARSDIFGGMRAALELFEDALPRIATEKLISHALQFDVGALIKRLGWLLEKLGNSSNAQDPLQAYSVSNYYLLDPQNRATGVRNARWHIIENLGEAPNA